MISAEKIRELLAKATKGPWIEDSGYGSSGDPDYSIICLDDGSSLGTQSDAATLLSADAALIVALANAAEELALAVEIAEAADRFMAYCSGAQSCDSEAAAVLDALLARRRKG